MPNPRPSWSVALLLPVALLCLMAPPVLPAQGPGPEVHPDRVMVKLRDPTEAVWQDAGVVSRTGVDLSPVLALFARGAVEPAITAAPLSVLDEWHGNAVAIHGDRAPGHLARWFRLGLRDAGEAAAVLRDLQACPLVEHAYLEPVFRHSSVTRQGGNDPPPPTPDFRPLQVYYGQPPTGLDISFAQGIVGGRGRAVSVCSVETDWFLGHEDLSKVNLGAFVGAPSPGNLGLANHGVAGASVLCADRNCFGMTGIADQVTFRMVAAPQNGGIANGLILAAVACQPGDIIMFVVQVMLGQVGLDDWIPAEYFQLEFDACLTLTSNGRLLVSSAANGGRSLDDPRHLRRFDRGFRDSGAIFSSATDGALLTRAQFANYGSRVDANGWGENGIACGYGTLFYPNNDFRQAYTAGYAGTSLSTPMVTGVVASLQGAARRQLGRSLTTAEVRQLLVAHGTPSPDTIGNRPDMRAMFQALGILDGLEMSSPDVAPGASVDVIMSGAAGGAAVLVAGFALQDTHFGFNRPLHLQLGSLLTVGFFPLGSGTARYTFAVPNSPVFQGADVFFQAGTLGAGPGVHVTNSGQVTIW